MEPAKFSPETQALAIELANVRKKIAAQQNAGELILQGIVEQLQKFSDLPTETAELYRREEALKNQLSDRVAAELASVVG